MNGANCAAHRLKYLHGSKAKVKTDSKPFMRLQLTHILQPGVAQRAAVSPVLVRQVRARVMRAHGAVVGRVSQRASVRGCSRGEGPVVLRGAHSVQTMNRVVVVGQAGRCLLVPGVTVAAELQKRRFRRVRGD